jgi:hypothetical protein
MTFVMEALYRISWRRTIARHCDLAPWFRKTLRMNAQPNILIHTLFHSYAR